MSHNPELPRPMRAVIFDLDGVLVQTERLGWRAWRGYLQLHGHDLPLEQYRRLIGRPSSAGYIRDHFSLPASLDELVLDHRQRLLALLETDLEVTPGAARLLAALRSRGCAVGLASNASSTYIHRVLELAGLGSAFDAIVSADQVAEGKPAPDVYLEAAARLGVAPAEAVAVEDSPPGDQAARAAGLRRIVIPNPDLPGACFAPGACFYPSLNAVYAALDQILAPSAATESSHDDARVAASVSRVERSTSPEQRHDAADPAELSPDPGPAAA